MTEPVGERASREEKARQPERVGVDDPLQLEKLVLRSLAMSGSATFTTVMSSSNMNVATQTAASVHQRFGCFSGTSVDRDVRAADRRAGVAGQEVDDLGDLRGADPGAVVGFGHGGAVGRRVDHGGKDGVDADALFTVLGVECPDEGKQRALEATYPAAPGNGCNAARVPTQTIVPVDIRGIAAAVTR